MHERQYPDGWTALFNQTPEGAEVVYYPTLEDAIAAATDMLKAHEEVQQ